MSTMNGGSINVGSRLADNCLVCLPNLDLNKVKTFNLQGLFPTFSLSKLNEDIRMYNTGLTAYSPLIRRKIESVIRQILESNNLEDMEKKSAVTSLQEGCSDILQKLSLNHEIAIAQEFINQSFKGDEQFLQVFEEILGLIKKSTHPSLIYYKNEYFDDRLALCIALSILDKNPRIHYDMIGKILAFHDFHILGDYLRALKTDNVQLKESIENLEDLKPDYRLVDQGRYSDFCKNNQNLSPKSFVRCERLDDIFNRSEDRNAVHFFFPGGCVDEDILDLFHRISGDLENFIDSCLDLEGINSIVRKGLIKKFQISKGRDVIVKKNNPDKVGRFQKEISNYCKIMERLGIVVQGDAYSFKGESGRDVLLKMLHPIAFFLDNSTGNYYSISPFQEGTTLEEILRTVFNSEQRAEHLCNIKKILNILYEKGILWGDMAPRNIIIKQVDDTWEYYIFDFEKTEVIQAGDSIQEEKKIEHHRGPMCVEEFGAVCSEEEIQQTFGEYFRPREWDLVSQAPVPFKQKREIVDLLKFRGKTSVNLGEYNALEREVIPVRGPLDQNSRRIYAIDPSFKIDHYIGSEFDRKTTEIYIKAKEFELFYEVVEFLNKILAVVDNDLLIGDIHSTIEATGFKFDTDHTPSFILLKEVIDVLYEVQSKDDFLLQLACLNRKVFLMSSAQSSCEHMAKVSKNTEFSEEKVESLLHDCAKQYELDLLLISGSFGRRELTFNSDIELFVFGNQSSQAKSAIQSKIFSSTGMYIDVYPIHTLASAEKFLRELPDYFIDFQNARCLYGSTETYASFLAMKERVFKEDGFLLEALYKQETFLTIEAKTEAFFSHGKIKHLLNAWNVIEAFQNFYSFPSLLSTARSVKEKLLYYKNHAEFCEAYGLDAGIKLNSDFEASVKLLLSHSFNSLEKFMREFHSSHTNKYIKEVISLNERHISLNNGNSNIQPFSISRDAMIKVSKIARPYLEPSINQMELDIESGQGALLKTFDGKRVIDFSSMTVNCILGQNDSWVKTKQLSYLLSSSPSFHSSKLGSYYYYLIPALLGDSHIGGMTDSTINHKQSNGSDAVELAMQAAFKHSNGRKIVVSFLGSYHGQGLTAFNISDKQTKHNFLNPLNENIRFLPAPPSGKVWNTPSLLEERRLNTDEEEIINQLMEKIKDTYAIVLEPIQGNNELRMFSLPLLRKIKEIAKANDVCLIFDEVQTGFGWLGKMTAAELYGIAPDILALSKATTSGNGPLSLTVFGGKYRGSVAYGASEKTNGADLRSLVALSAVYERLNGVSDLEELNQVTDVELKQELNDGLLKQYENKAKLLQSCIANLVSDFGDIIEAPIGMGLMRGIKIHSSFGSKAPGIAQEIYQTSLEKGLFLRVVNDCILIKPPLVISEDEIYQAFRLLNEAFLESRKNLLID